MLHCLAKVFIAHSSIFRIFHIFLNHNPEHTGFGLFFNQHTVIHGLKGNRRIYGRFNFNKVVCICIQYLVSLKMRNFLFG